MNSFAYDVALRRWLCPICWRPYDVCYELNIWQWWHEDAESELSDQEWRAETEELAQGHMTIKR